MDYFKENAIVVITTDGKICAVPRDPKMTKHQDAFLLLTKYMGEDLLSGMEEFHKSGGFDLAAFVAAQGNIVIWPSDIRNSEYMIVTLPSPCLTQEQVNNIDKIEVIFHELENHKVYIQSSMFKVPSRKSKVINKLLYQKETFEGAIEIINTYIQRSKMMYDFNSEILNDDIREVAIKK